MKKFKYLPIFIMFVFATQMSHAAPAEYPGARGKPFEAIQEQIDEIEASIAEQVAALQSQISELESQVLANSENIALLHELQETQDQLIAVLFTAVAKLQSQVAKNTSDITALTNWNQYQDMLIFVLNQRTASLQQQVSANDQDIAALIQYDAVVQNLISALQGKVNLLEIQISQNSGDITILQTQVTDLTNQISSLQTELGSKQDRITGSCPTGYSIRVIYADGTVSCEYDNTSAGVGTLTSTSAWSSLVSIPARRYRSASVTCPSGYRVTGGGFDKESNTIEIYSNYKWYNGWRIYAFNSSYTNTRDIYANATCAKVQ